MELEIIKNSIHEIRGKKVMLDMDLAILYENAYVKSKVYMAVDSENPKKYQIEENRITKRSVTI